MSEQKYAIVLDFGTESGCMVAVDVADGRVVRVAVVKQTPAQGDGDA